MALVVLCSLMFGWSTSPSAGTEMMLETPGGEVLEVRVSGTRGEQKEDRPLFIWLDNQYGETERPDRIAAELAAEGALVWQVDVLESLFLERSADAIRSLDGEPVAALIEAATRATTGSIVVVACDRMAAPALRGMRTWQRGRDDDASRDRPSALAGAVLFFPNLYRGTPVAGEAPELLSIVRGTNLPVMVMQPALGTNRARLDELLDTLRDAGSAAYAWIVDDVRDYYVLRAERPATEAFETMSGPVPPEVELAIRETPARLLAAARLLAFGPHPVVPVTVAIDDDEPVAPAYGLIPREVVAPGFALLDAKGRAHALDDSFGRITLVNFWATWCPPCVHEIPSMNRLAAGYDPTEFAIVSINFKESPEHVRAFMERVEVDFPVLMDEDGRVSAEWGVFAFPSSFLLDRDGSIRYSVNTAIEWDADEVHEVIRRLLAEPFEVRED